MKVSVNWMRLMNRNYGCSDSSELANIDKLVDKIGAQLGAVEEVVELGRKYKGILVVKVAECQKHPNADKLSLCLVDDGGTDKKVKRTADNLIQIVCGAPNVKAGLLAAWIPPGTAVPSTYDKDPFVIESRPIRNKTSHGMLASPKELDLGDNHEGILELDSGKPGDNLIDNLQLDDYVIDIENKMFTHRPDCFGILGIAREIAGINQKPFKSPDWYRQDADLPADGRKNVLKLKIENRVPELVPRFCAVAIKDVKVQPSPAWLQSFLARSGIRPINNIVDITNWFMLATAQPLHAYDYDKVKTGVLGARLSKKSERLKLLNGKEITLNDGAVVITNGQKPIGLGGIMGGSETEVDETTKNIVIECASFDMNQTRRTAFEYGLFTDAATRFTKNQSPRQNRAVLVKTVNDTLQLVGGRVASPLIDDYPSRAARRAPRVVRTSAECINSRLGLKLGASEIKKLLENVEFDVHISSTVIGRTSHTGEIVVTVPFWRTDIEIPEDIVEEVGRLYGYDKLPVVLPRRDLAPARRDELVDFKSDLRQILARAGANEVLTYSFVHGDLLKKAGQNPNSAFRVANALSPDLQYYRLSITPSLLEKVHPNIKAGFDEFVIFEVGLAHGNSEFDADGLPKEFGRLAMVFASKDPKPGAAFYWIKKYVEFTALKLYLDLRYEPLNYTAFPVEKHELFAQMLAVYEPERSALVFAGDKLAGVAGEFRQDAKKALKLPGYCAGAELFLSTLQESKGLPYQPLNRYPEITQDICLRVSAHTANVAYGDLENLLERELAKLSRSRGYIYSFRPLDIFQRQDDQAHKQITWRIILWHPKRTLTTAESNQLLDDLAKAAKIKFKAERV